MPFNYVPQLGGVIIKLDIRYPQSPLLRRECTHLALQSRFAALPYEGSKIRLGQFNPTEWGLERQSLKQIKDPGENWHFNGCYATQP